MNAKAWRFFVIALISMYLPVAESAGEVYAPDIEWKRSYGGSGTDWPHSIQQTKDGGYIVAGRSDSNDGNTTENHGRADFWVVKLDPIGDIVWQKSLGGSQVDVALSAQQTSDGDYIVAGFTHSRDGNVGKNQGKSDGWVIKLDSNGEMIWQKTYGGSEGDVIFDIRQTTDGGYIFTGTTSSNDGDINGNDFNKVSPNMSSCWVVKLDSNGTIQWQKVLGGSKEDWGNTVRQTKDGGYIVVGSTTSSDGDVPKNNGNQDFWIIKLDASGEIVWQKTFGGSMYEIATSIEQTTDEGYIVTGHSSSNDGDVSGNRGSFDYWIIRLNAEGSLIWQRPLGGEGLDWATSAQQTNDGGYIIAGQSDSKGGDITGKHVGFAYWIVKLNTEGGILWQKSLGRSVVSHITSRIPIQQTSDRGYIMAGCAHEQVRSAYTDFWVIKLKPEQ